MIESSAVWRAVRGGGHGNAAMMSRPRMGGVMTKIGLASFALVALAAAHPAQAADAALPAYKAPVLVPFYNWTGGYVGANVGYGWGSSNPTFAFADPAAANPAAITTINAGASNRVDGMIGGLQ